MTVRRAAVAALAAGLLLAGCAGDPEPRFAEPTDPPSSPSADSSSAEPERQSAEEFIREWFAVGTRMQNTGDTESFLALSGSCQPCAKFAREVQAVYDAGGHIEIRGERVVKIRRLKGRSADRPEFIVDVHATPTIYGESEGSPEKSFPGGFNSYQVTLQRTEAGWLLKDYLDRS